MGSVLRCAVCGDRIGVYEPFVVIQGDGSVLTRSLANDPSVPAADEVCIHRGCRTHTTVANAGGA